MALVAEDGHLVQGHKKRVRQRGRQRLLLLRGHRLEHVANRRLQATAGASHRALSPRCHRAVRADLEVRAPCGNDVAVLVRGLAALDEGLLGHLSGRQRQDEHADHQDEDHDRQTQNDLLHQAALLLYLFEGLGGGSQLPNADLAAAVGIPLPHDTLDALRHVLVVQLR